MLEKKFYNLIMKLGDSECIMRLNYLLSLNTLAVNAVFLHTDFNAIV